MSLAAGLLLLLVPISRAWSIEVVITSPMPHRPLFGEVDFAADVFPSDEARKVEFLLDGEVVGEIHDPPFRMKVNVGGENRRHLFAVKAHSIFGEVGEDSLTTPAVRIDLEVDANLQQLYVTVTRDGKRVLGLGEADFSVLDNGRRQQVVTFARGDVRLTAAILVDASTSMRGQRLRFALQGATAFVQGLRAVDEASLVIFSDQLLHDTPFSSQSEVLTKDLESVRAAGGTALNDHLYLVLKRLEQEQGRRVVVLLSDGIDSHSSLRMEEVSWLARRSRALLYWIRVGSDGLKSRFSAWKDADAYRAEYRLLGQTVAESGGRTVVLGQLDQARGAFGEILRELREQYVLGYYPTQAINDSSWHRVQVRVRGGGLEVRTRGGYVDY